MPRRKRKRFEPVARKVRAAFRASEKEASRLLTEFLGYPVEVKRVRVKPGKPGDTITEGQMTYRGRKRAAADALASREEWHNPEPPHWDQQARRDAAEGWERDFEP